MSEAEEPEKTGSKLERDEKGRFVDGHEGIGGRPQGSLSIKTKIKQMFEEDPKKFMLFVEKLIESYPSLVWQMLEGRPPQDITSGGKPIEPITKINYIIPKDGDNIKTDQ